MFGVSGVFGVGSGFFILVVFWGIISLRPTHFVLFRLENEKRLGHHQCAGILTFFIYFFTNFFFLSIESIEPLIFPACKAIVNLLWAGPDSSSSGKAQDSTFTRGSGRHAPDKVFQYMHRQITEILAWIILSSG